MFRSVLANLVSPRCESDSSSPIIKLSRSWDSASNERPFTVASNIHVAGGRNAFSQRSLSNMQIARLACSKSMKKCEGVVL
jgi:hypothetical protein